jgi:hypothetical protein
MAKQHIGAALNRTTDGQWLPNGRDSAGNIEKQQRTFGRVGNKAFINRFPAFRCAIDHAPRLSGLTDHSAVVLEVE